MKYMIAWKVRPGCYKTAVQKFLKTGGKPPKSVTTVGRWHAPGSNVGWHLVETDDYVGIAEQIAEWAELLETEVYPVLDDQAAAEAAVRVYGPISND
jgi:Protein of unknown function (DUF3303)